VTDRLASSSDSLPPSFEGVLIANELLDALPAHQVVMRAGGLREVYVDVSAGRLVTREGPLSTPALAGYLDRLNVVLEPGWRVEINLRALEWIRDVARRLSRGFVILIDYGHEAQELYSPTHASGTLTTFTRHTMAGPESSRDSPSWLARPGEQDITAHVDFTSVSAAAEAEGLTRLGFLDQTYFLLALANLETPANAANLENPANLASPENLKRRLALKTLLMPGGLGSTHKVMIFGKGVGAPALLGCSYKMRVT
jgi:SAM-dependent MidA family methyltransferase